METVDSTHPFIHTYIYVSPICSGDVQVQILLPLGSLLELAYVLDVYVPSMERPLGALPKPIALLARFDRWVETIMELGLTNTISELFLSNNYPGMYAFLSLAIQRLQQSDCSSNVPFKPAQAKESGGTQRTRGQGILRDRGVVRLQDVRKIKATVRDIFAKMLGYKMRGEQVIEALKDARFSDAEIAYILSPCPIQAVVEDLYRRGDIAYGLYWLRSWYSLWYVEMWDPLSRELFGENGEGEFRGRDSRESVKELQVLYHARYQEILPKSGPRGYASKAWTELMNTKIYYFSSAVTRW